MGLKEIRQGDVFLLEVRWQESGEEWGKFFRYYLDQLNFLSPDLSDRSRWSFQGEDAPLYESVLEQGKRAIRIKSPGRYSTMSQSLQLRSNALYQLEAEVKGDATVCLRARTVKRPGKPAEACTVWTRPSSEYRRYSVRFPTGETGEALIIIGTTDASGRGNVFIRNLTVAKEVQFESFGQQIVVQADGSSVIVEKFWLMIAVLCADANDTDIILVCDGTRCKVYADVKRYDLRLGHLAPDHHLWLAAYKHAWMRECG